jgi:hypothetical protein
MAFYIIFYNKIPSPPPYGGEHPTKPPYILKEPLPLVN